MCFIGYKSVVASRQGDLVVGGFALLIQNNTDCQPIHKEKFMSFTCFRIRLNFRKGLLTYSCCNICRPPCQELKSFINEFKLVLTFMTKYHLTGVANLILICY